MTSLILLMLDLNFIRNNKETVLNGLKKKQSSIDEQFIDQIIQLDETRRDLQQQTDSLRAQKNEASDKIAQLQGDEKQAAIMKMKEVSDQEKDLSQKLKDAETKLKEMMLQVPNLPAADVPKVAKPITNLLKSLANYPNLILNQKTTSNSASFSTLSTSKAAKIAPAHAFITSKTKPSCFSLP